MKKIIDIITTASDKKLAEKITATFNDAKKNLLLQNYKYAGLEVGHFVEAVRRFLEYKLFGTYTPLSKKLSFFTEKELKKYENSSGSANYRMLIPRSLFAIYSIRNKRNIGHLSSIDSTRIDAQFMVQTCKWVLAEIIRNEATLPTHELEALIEKVVEREIPIIWKNDKFEVVTLPSLKATEKAMVVLLDNNGQTIKEIATKIRYENFSRLRIQLKTLIKSGDLHLHNDQYFLSPTGIKKAENIVLQHKVF